MTAKSIQEITQQIQEAGGPDQSVEVLCTGIADQITQSKNNPQALINFANELRAGNDDLLQAVGQQFYNRAGVDGAGFSERTQSM
ncbi:MAG: hypothetical protein M3Q39_01635 [Actinomycetota bacterium]|nr:hypothetical protein [Actinomycetota bacterium]